MSVLINLFFINPLCQIYAAHILLSVWLAIYCSMIKLQSSLPLMKTDFLSCHQLPQVGLGSHFPSPSWDSVWVVLVLHRMCLCPSLWASCLRTQGNRRCGGDWKRSRSSALPFQKINEKLGGDGHSWRDAWWPLSSSELPICCFLPNFQMPHTFLFRSCLCFPPWERESVNSPQGLLVTLV